MGERQNRKRDVYISQSCIDSSRVALEQDPDSSFIFIRDHSYQIKPGFTDEDEAVNLPITLHIAGTDFPVTIPFQSYKVGELRKKVREGEAMDITNLIKRMRIRKR